MNMLSSTGSVLILILFSVSTNAFITSRAFAAKVSQAITQLPMSGGESGHIERVEFTIHSDGRVEETVKGVRGPNCGKVTDEINEMLGEVTATRPTEEMYEQEITINQNVEQKLDGSADSMTSSW